MAAAARLTVRIEEGTGSQPVAVQAVQQPAHVAEANLPQPVAPQHLATLPKAPAQADPLALMDSAGMAVAAKAMSAWAMTAQRDVNAVCFAITSIGGGAGDTSLAAVALARAMAQLGRRVVIVDLSRVDSWLENLCAVAAGPGVADLVNGEAAFTKVIGRDAKSAVHLLRFGQDHSARAMALLDERIGSVLAALGNSYDAVIVHAGEATPETPALLRKCEAVLVLAPAMRLADATAAVKALSESGVHAVCHVLIGRPEAGTAPEFSLVAAHA